MQLTTIKKIAGFLLSLGIITAALISLYYHTQNISISTVIGTIRATPVTHIALSICFTLISFCALGIYEIIAVKTTIRKKIHWKTAILAGTIGNAFGNTLGFHAVTISAWRYKIYNKVGLDLADIARISGIAFIGMVLGVSCTAAINLLLDNNISGLFIIFVIFIFIFWLARKSRNIKLKSWSLLLPGPSFALLQIITGLVEMSAAIGAAYILFPANIDVSFSHFSVLYIGAALLGMASSTPGGIGVFEAAFLVFFATQGKAEILAALLLYRVIYNLIPFCIACIATAIYQLRKR